MTTCFRASGVVPANAGQDAGRHKEALIVIAASDLTRMCGYSNRTRYYFHRQNPRVVKHPGVFSKLTGDLYWFDVADSSAPLDLKSLWLDGGQTTIVSRIAPLIQSGRWVNHTEQLQGDVEVHVFSPFRFFC
jgi:hypothetical protein